MRPIGAVLIAVATILAATFATIPARAGDADGIRAVIDAQITAFRADDGPAAYSFAAPSIRRIFTNPDMFMSMVRSGYQPVYRPKSVTFGRLRTEGGRSVQEVFVVDPDGEPWTALYSMELQDDGTWKISGCRLVRSPGESA